MVNSTSAREFYFIFLIWLQTKYTLKQLSIISIYIQVTFPVWLFTNSLAARGVSPGVLTQQVDSPAAPGGRGARRQHLNGTSQGNPCETRSGNPGQSWRSLGLPNSFSLRKVSTASSPFPGGDRRCRVPGCRVESRGTQRRQNQRDASSSPRALAVLRPGRGGRAAEGDRQWQRSDKWHCQLLPGAAPPPQGPPPAPKEPPAPAPGACNHKLHAREWFFPGVVYSSHSLQQEGEIHP